MKQITSLYYSDIIRLDYQSDCPDGKPLYYWGYRLMQKTIKTSKKSPDFLYKTFAKTHATFYISISVFSLILLWLFVLIDSPIRFWRVFIM